ncbi:MAG: RluA family pseudouridine synthase [Rhodothermia bacterium]
MDILHLDNHLLVAVKPAGMLAQRDSTGDPDFLSDAKQYLKVRFNKPGKVFVGLVHRLDRPVSGVVVFARTSKAAGRLSTQFRERTVEKEYLAMTEGRITEKSVLRHYLKKGRFRTDVVRPTVAGAREAVLECNPILVVGRWSLVHILLKTGRPQQIRAQLAAIKHPILGDTRYGAGSWGKAGGIALHCWRMGLVHPVTKEPMQWSAPPPKSWPSEVFEFLSSRPNYLASDKRQS